MRTRLAARRSLRSASVAVTLPDLLIGAVIEIGQGIVSANRCRLCFATRPDTLASVVLPLARAAAAASAAAIRGIKSTNYFPFQTDMVIFLVRV